MRRITRWWMHRGPVSPSPSNQSCSSWRGVATSAQSSQPHWPTLSHEVGQQAGVPPRSAAVVAAAAGIKKPCPRWQPRGDPNNLRCAMMRTCPPCTFKMFRTCGPFWRGLSSPPCTAMFFAKTVICVGCVGNNESVKNCISPPPLSWQPPSPGYLKWLGRNDSGACSLPAKVHLPPPNPQALLGLIQNFSPFLPVRGTTLDSI